MPNICPRKCYFQFRINDEEASERVIFELYDDMAPIMASKFREFCTGTLGALGYLGSKVFPVCLNPMHLIFCNQNIFLNFSTKLSTINYRRWKVSLVWEEVKFSILKIICSLLTSHLCRPNLVRFYLLSKRITFGWDTTHIS